MPATTPLETVDRESHVRGVPGLRGTGIVGHACVVVLIIAVLVAILGPLIAPYGPEDLDIGSAFVGPTGDHYLGYTGQGTDLFSLLVLGARSSLLGPLLVVFAAMVLGIAVAVISAWRGGLVDQVLSVILDVLFAFPGILLAILAAAVFGASLQTAAIALAIAYAPYIARVLRSAAVQERNQPYIAALEVQGFSAWRICLRHLVPNVSGLIVAQATIIFGYAMVDLAAISYIGLGVQPPTPDWGVRVAEGQSGVLQGYPAESLSAAICIIIVVVAVNLLGERLNERAENAGR
ncbi:MAG: ABC transporter permease [Gaiellales bacterium]